MYVGPNELRTRTTHVVRRSCSFPVRFFAAAVIEPVSSSYRLNELRGAVHAARALSPPGPFHFFPKLPRFFCVRCLRVSFLFFFSFFFFLHRCIVLFLYFFLFLFFFSFEFLFVPFRPKETRNSCPHTRSGERYTLTKNDSVVMIHSSSLIKRSLKNHIPTREVASRRLDQKDISEIASWLQLTMFHGRKKAYVSSYKSAMNKFLFHGYSNFTLLFNSLKRNFE